MGEYDMVVVIEAPNDETVMSLMLKVGSAGYGRTKTLKAFTAEEGMKIIKDLAWPSAEEDSLIKINCLNGERLNLRKSIVYTRGPFHRSEFIEYPTFII
jgi:GYD domain